MFGQSGFGLAANYTIVDSGLTTTTTSLGEQFALVGPERLGQPGRLLRQGPGRCGGLQLARRVPAPAVRRPGPEPELHRGLRPARPERQLPGHRQPDPAAGGINLTDETQRCTAVTRTRCVFATQTGPRYMFGAALQVLTGSDARRRGVAPRSRGRLSPLETAACDLGHDARVRSRQADPMTRPSC